MSQPDEPRDLPDWEALKRIRESWVRKILTGCPGVVVRYDPAKKRADVRIPFVDTYKKDDGTLRDDPWPEIPDVDVKFPRGGGWVVTWPLKEGDPVWLEWSMYPLDEHQAGNGQADEIYPQSVGRHRPSDVTCKPMGGFPDENNPGQASPENYRIEHEDGQTIVELMPGGKIRLTGDTSIHGRLNVGSDNASTPLALAPVTNDHLAEIATAVNAIIAAATATGGFVIPPPDPVGFLGSVASGKAFTDD